MTAARDLTARWEQLLGDLESELDPDTGVVRLAFLDSIATSLVPRVLRSFHAQAPRVRALPSQDLAAIEGLVAAGLGIAIVPEPFAGQSGTIGIRIAADGARRTIGLTWRSDRALPPPAARFRDFVTTGPR